MVARGGRLSPHRSIRATSTHDVSTPNGQRREGPQRVLHRSREFDVTPRTIRFYEDQGLLAPRREGQRRIYTQRERTRLKLTLRGKRLGLSLSEIRELIDMYEPGRDERPQLERFLNALESHRAALEQQRTDIEAQLSEIAVFEKRVRKQLARER